MAASDSPNWLKAIPAILVLLIPFAVFIGYTLWARSKRVETVEWLERLRAGRGGDGQVTEGLDAMARWSGDPGTAFEGAKGKSACYEMRVDGRHLGVAARMICIGKGRFTGYPYEALVVTIEAPGVPPFAAFVDSRTEGLLLGFDPGGEHLPADHPALVELTGAVTAVVSPEPAAAGAALSASETARRSIATLARRGYSVFASLGRLWALKLDGWEPDLDPATFDGAILSPLLELARAVGRAGS